MREKPKSKISARGILLVGVALIFTGCTKSNLFVFHVVTADTCDSPSAVGIIGNKEFALDVLPKDRPRGVACFGYFRMEDVGKDFPVSVDFNRGIVTVEIQGASKTLMIEKVREVR
jgi:hypothetical protein